VSFEQARNFGSSLLASAVRLGSGAVARALGPRPREALILYEIEWCPYSRLVREALSELDLDALIKPCPSDERRHHAELEQLGQRKVPYLVDRSAGVQLGDSSKIIEHLFAHYGDGSPVPLRYRGGFAHQTSRLVSTLRGGELNYERPARDPELTLELWNYEGSPYCRLAREQLGKLGLAYVSRNLARNSPRREEFRSRYGLLQFPRLYDPNTKIGLFETDAILSYLKAHYALAPIPINEAASAHPA
jgi:glutathione S-transferase